MEPCSAWLAESGFPDAESQAAAVYIGPSRACEEAAALEGAMEQENYARYPSLKDRVVLITGGATGIGESLVRNFARQGAQIAFFDIQDEPGRALAKELGAAYTRCDVTDVQIGRAHV